MSVPYTFASASSPLPLSELDANFATAITLGSTAMVLGGTYTTISGLTLNSPVFTGTFALGTPTSGTLTNCTGYTYANLAGTVPTWNQDTTGNAATATTATYATTAGSTNTFATANYQIQETGGKLYFYHSGLPIASLDSSGNFVTLANTVAGGTP